MSDPGEENLPRFFADCMLGRLARWLRALGCDTLYERAIDDNELLRRCRDEARVLLTRDNELAHRGGGLEVLFIESESTAAQLKQVMRAFGLQICEERLFSRCTHCNNPVEELPKEKARGRVPPSFTPPASASPTARSATRSTGGAHTSSASLRR